MSFSYTLGESISGFKRAKLSTFVSIVTISISLLLLGLFAVITVHAARLIEALRDKVEMEVFLQEPLTRQEITNLEKQIASSEGVEQAAFVSKEEAARIFKEEFGEDISKVLDFNPLPPSFKVHLREGYKTSAAAKEVHDRLASIKGVDEVIYRKTLLEIIDERTALINNLTLSLGLLISISAIMLVSNTIRLAIYAKRRILKTMEFVGATAMFIRIPFLLEGIIQGFVGGLVAAAVLYFLLEFSSRLLSIEFSDFIHMDTAFYLLVVVAGTALGLIGGIISVARFMKLSQVA